MSAPNVIPPGDGEVIGDAPDRRVEILSDHEALNATWSRFGPRRDGAELHVHRRHTDLFYVLDGALTVRLGPEGDGVLVPAGTLVRVPPLVVHGFGNETDAEVRYLNLHAPGRGFADYLRALRDGRTPSYDQEPPPPDGGRPPTEAIVGLPGVVADVPEIAITETSSAPGRPAEPPHVHHHHVESVYVLEGELALTAGDRELRAPAGSWLQVPPGVEHAFSVPGSEPARSLSLRTPSCGFGTFVRGGDAFDQHPA